MKRNSELILISILILFLIIPLSFVIAQESVSSSTTIEIVPDAGKTPTPEPSPSFTFKADPESYKRDPFISPLDENSEKVTVKPEEEKEAGVNKEGVNPVAPEPSSTPAPPVTPYTQQAKAEADVSRFHYTGCLWDSQEYVGIISADDKSYIVREGDELSEGYSVFYLDDKELILINNGRKGILKLNQ